MLFSRQKRENKCDGFEFLERQMIYCADDIWPLYSLTNSRFGSSRNAGALGIQLSSRVARATFWRASAVNLYGLRSKLTWRDGLRDIVECYNAKFKGTRNFGGRRLQLMSSAEDKALFAR